MGTSPRLSEAFDEYLETLRIQGRSPSTIKARRLLCRTMLHSTGNLYLRSLTEKHVDQFFADNPQWSPATRAKMVAYLSAFLGWSQQRRYMPSNHDLLAHMRGIKTPKRKRLQIPPEKFPELLEAANNPRDRIVIALGIYLMLRGSEISHLRWHHVHLDEWEIEPAATWAALTPSTTKGSRTTTGFQGSSSQESPATTRKSPNETPARVGSFRPTGRSTRHARSPAPTRASSSR